MPTNVYDANLVNISPCALGRTFVSPAAEITRDGWVLNFLYLSSNYPLHCKYKDSNLFLKINLCLKVVFRMRWQTLEYQIRREKKSASDVFSFAFCLSPLASEVKQIRMLLVNGLRSTATEQSLQFVQERESFLQIANSYCCLFVARQNIAK